MASKLSVVSKPHAARAARGSVSAAAVLSTAMLVVVVLLLLQGVPSLLPAARDARRWHQRHFDNVSTPVRRDWADGEAAAECQPIFEKLRRARLLCGRHRSGRSCDERPDWRSFKLGSVWMFSQFGQDAYLYTRHFTHLRRRGVYLDVASNDAVHLSNSFFFDRCLGWKGVCVEGNPRYYERTFSQRSCLLVPTCAGATDGEEVPFVLDGETGGVAGASYKFGNGTRGRDTMLLRCTRVQSVLDRAGIRRVDFFSLDVEGHELQVLKGIDWERTRIDVISVEHTHSFESVSEMLTGLGYVRHVVGQESANSPVGAGFLGMDAIFVRGDVRLGEPDR